MATQQQAATQAYRCPNCNGDVAFTGGTWGCVDCQYVPRHSAD